LSAHLNDPWIIGITGTPGSGKTHVLAQLIAYLSRTGKPFDGFLSVAENRICQTSGASRYVLHFSVTDFQIELCHRVDSGNPPYKFNDVAWQSTDDWLSDIESAPTKPTILILDEFGKLEAKGNGFAHYWQRVYALRPQLIVLSVREGYKSELEATLGFTFDLMLKADDPTVPDQLIRCCETIEDWQKLGRYGAGAGAVEMSLGSALHASRIPFRGVPLAIMQSLILFFGGNTLMRPFMVVWVSYIAAALKTLSPVGNRIRPMLAIMMQGSLFGLSVKFWGWNTAGIGVGAWLIGAWAVLQGFIFQYLLFGIALFTAFTEVQQWIWHKTGIMIVSLPLLVAMTSIIAGSASAALTLFFYFRKKLPAIIHNVLSSNDDGYRRANDLTPKPGVFQRIWFEYRQKAFWIPMVLMLVLLILSGTAISDVTMVIARACGILTAIMVLFSFLKPTKIRRLLQYFGFVEAGIVLGRVLK
jgi:nucleoside-triphosphatase THEP1